MSVKARQWYLKRTPNIDSNSLGNGQSNGQPVASFPIKT
jgi:hypothetical protein